MPNQYTKVDLHLEVNPPLHMPNLNEQYTKALFDVLKNKISPDPQLIDEIIKKVKEEL